MRVVIAGDREINENDLALVEDAIKASGFKITQVVCGEAKGGDMLGKRWAQLNKIHIKEFPADWKNIHSEGAIVKVGKFGSYDAGAGFKRNQKMADYADAVIALQPNGNTSGTSDMMDRARKKGIPVFIWPQRNPEETKSNDFCYTF